MRPPPATRQQQRLAVLKGWLDFIKSGDYLKFLAANGYPLAPVEEGIIGDRYSDAVYADTLHRQQEQSDDSDG